MTKTTLALLAIICATTSAHACCRRFCRRSWGIALFPVADLVPPPALPLAVPAAWDFGFHRD